MSEQASSSRTRHQSEFQGYVSATRELRQSCQDLVPGQMISVPGFTLMDSMAALQIMDPRMDSGIVPIPNHLIADCDTLPKDGAVIPSFDPQSELSVEDICWIMDRLMACEMEWHRGASLSQTIYTCEHVHCLASLDANACLSAGREPNWLVLRVLQPYLIALLKSVGLIWDEIVKGNVVDGEDFNSDKAGVSLLEHMEPEEAIDRLQEAISYTQALQTDKHSIHDEWTRNQVESLLMRLEFRKCVLQAISTFSKADLSLKLGQASDFTHMFSDLPLILQEAQSWLDQLEEENISIPGHLCLMNPSFSNAPSIRAMSMINPHYSRHPAYNGELNAPSAPPPPLPLRLKSPSQTIVSYRALLRGMYDARLLVAGDAGWAQWKAFMQNKAINFQREPTFAYIRSIWQSMICTESIVGLRYPLTWIADSFLKQEAGLSHGTLIKLALGPLTVQATGNISQTSLIKRSEYFLERLAGQLVSYLCSLAQNRSRGRRSLAVTYPMLLELSAEAAALDATLADVYRGQIEEGIQLASSVQVLTLEVMQHIIYSGFELQLYRLEECAIVYWIAHRVAEEKILLIESMQTEQHKRILAKKSNHLQSLLHFNKAIASSSKAMELLFESKSMVRQIRPPWYPSAEDEENTTLPRTRSKAIGTEDKVLEDIDRVAFCKRFKWLKGKGRPEGMQTLDNLWLDFQAERKILKTKSTKDRLGGSSQCLKEALEELKQAREIHDDGECSALVSSLQNIYQACQSEKDQSTQFCLVPLSLEHHTTTTTFHPWLPVLLHTQS